MPCHIQLILLAIVADDGNSLADFINFSIIQIVRFNFLLLLSLFYFWNFFLLLFISYYIFIILYFAYKYIAHKSAGRIHNTYMSMHMQYILINVNVYYWYFWIYFIFY